MAKHISETPATQWLKQNKVVYTEHSYDYVDHGGTAESSKQLGVPEHQVVKTLVMQDDQGKGLVVLMHGDCKTSTKNLARQIGCKTVEPCKPDVAQKNSGYLVGGTSPFGLRKAMPVYVESSILELPQIWINGGRRGFLLAIDPKVLVNELGAKPVQCALPQ
jgi:Cys-tRNA(Pro) deacylase